MSVKAKTEEAPATSEQPVDLQAARQQDQMYSQQPHLTPDVREALSAPLDPAYLRERKGDNGKMYTYADLDYLESRASQVDPDWQNPAFTPLGEHGLSCTIVILGVQRSATAGYYVADEYEVWDKNKGERGGYVSRPMTSRVAHTIITAAQAASERRTFAKFGLGAELWAHNEQAYEADRENPSGAKAQATRQTSDFREPSEKRIKVLNDLGVPTSIAKLINSTGRGKGDDGYDISDVSNVIKALWAARTARGEKGALPQKTWELVIAEHAPYALKAGTSAAEDDDEDFA